MTPFDEQDHDLAPAEAEALRALREAYAARAHDARIPEAGQVWWRAAVRARLEAAETASRPITWLQGVAAACAVGVGIALLGFAWPTLAATALRVTALTEAVPWVVPVAMTLAVCVIVAPVAVYFALSDD